MAKRIKAPSRESGRAQSDPILREIRSALRPDASVAWEPASAILPELQRIRGKIDATLQQKPALALKLYEALYQACQRKAEDIDDSDGELGAFAGNLVLGWIQARQSAGLDPDETVRLLLKRMDDDPYGFCNDTGQQAVEVLDEAGLAAFDRVLSSHLDTAVKACRKQGSSPLEHFEVSHWGVMLKAVCARRQSVPRYIELTRLAGLDRHDCLQLAELCRKQEGPQAALEWVERGLRLGPLPVWSGGVGLRLEQMRRELLAELGRGHEGGSRVVRVSEKSRA